VSPGIVGLFIMLALLGSGAVKMEAVEEGAKFVLGELVFFFLPIIVAVVKYKDLFIASGWQLLVCIFVGTVLVMLSTALTLSYCYKWRRRLFKRRHA
jgi:holin-like protein